MNQFKTVHRLFAAVTFVFSFLIYLRTLAPTVSFWDCGEFIACSYILGIPHPPGAPFYLLIGRIFSMIPFSADIGFRVNLVSALSSSFAVMFTYLIIVQLIKQWRGEPKNSDDLFILVFSGLLGSLSLALSDTFWFNSVEAEVYAISMFFTTFVVWLTLVWLEKADQPGNEKYLLFIAYLVGLAIAVHLLMILVLPAMFLIIYYHYLDRRGEKLSWKNFIMFLILTAGIFFIIYPGVVQYVPTLAGKLGEWFLFILFIGLIIAAYFAITSRKKITSLALMSVVLIMMGYSTYALIYIRSGLDPAIDENDPENIQQMVKYLNREQYGTWSTFPRRFPGLPLDWQFKQQYPNRNYATFQLSKQLDFMWNYQMKKMYWRYFGWQFIGKGTTLGPDDFISENFSLKGILGLPFLIGLMGMVHHFYKHRRHAWSIAALFFLTGLAIVIYLNQENPQPRERDYVFVGSFFAFAIWIGMGATAIMEWIQEAFREKTMLRKGLMYGVAGAFFIMAPMNLLAHNFSSHDRKGNYVAHDYSYNLLQSCEPNAILFTNGDNDTFPLWYLQFVENVRPDVRVVNLSLLNTNWYIRQLKHQEPLVPVSLSDEQIDQLEIIPWEKQTVRIPISPAARERELADPGSENLLLPESQRQISELVVTIEPTLMGQALRVQDIMILNILYANRWQKPIYFAVTVSDDNKVNLNKYLRMDGLTFKLVPYEGQYISSEKLEKNLVEIFRYRGLDDPTVHYDDNIVGLLQNYRAAFLRLIHQYLQEGKMDRMVEMLDKMEQAMPRDVIPMPDIRIALQVGQLYDFAGRPEEFIDAAEWSYKREPENPMAVGTLVSLYSREKKHDQAIKLLEEWIKKHPEDSEAVKKLDEEKSLLSAVPKTPPVETDTTR